MKLSGVIEKYSRALILVLVLMVAVPPGTFGQQAAPPAFKPEELEQILAPIALYPDSLLAQVCPWCSRPAKRRTSMYRDR